MFNDSYDKVILPYSHIDSIMKLYQEFCNDFYNTSINITPFQDEGILYRYMYDDKHWNNKVQWEKLDEHRLLVTCSCKSENQEYPSIQLYEQGTFPIVSHKIHIPEFWFIFDVLDRSMIEFKAKIDVENENASQVSKYLTSEVMEQIMQKCIYDNKFHVECVNLIMFVFWYANTVPEKIQSEDDGRRSKRQVKDIKNHHGKINRYIPLVRKRFIIKCSSNDSVSKTEPDHKVYVRGHYRHYRNGKTVYIKPFTKYNDKPDTHHKTYIV